MRINYLPLRRKRPWEMPVDSLPERGRMVVTGLGPRRFGAQGKVQPHLFFPIFCEALRTEGISTRFVTSAQELARAVVGNCAVVHVFQEVSVRIDFKAILDAQRKATLVFNHPQMGPVIARKDDTHRFLTRHGIPMPAMNAIDGPIFSNHVQSCAAPVAVVDDASQLDRSRYNTRFVDTRVAFEGREYYTTVRLLCVGREILHAYVRARDVVEQIPSVHAKDSPLNPALLEHLQAGLVTARMAELKELARALADALGPGFYSHDLLIERSTDLIYVCETGFKFNDWSYTDRISPIAHMLPSHRWMLTPEFPRRSAEAFLAEWLRLAPI